MDPTPSLLSFGETIALIRRRLNVSSEKAAAVVRDALKSGELYIIRDDHELHPLLLWKLAIPCKQGLALGETDHFILGVIRNLCAFSGTINYACCNNNSDHSPQ